MPQAEFELLDYLHILWRRKWVLLLSIFVGLGISYYQTKKITPIYETSGTIKIQPQSIAVGERYYPYPAYVSEVDMATHVKMINSYPIVEAVIRELRWVSEKATVTEIEQAVRKLQGRISAQQIEKTNIIRISATSNDSLEAVDIVNAAGRVYKEENLREKNRQARTLRKFIEDQLKIAEGRLTASEQAMKEFKEKEQISKAVPEVGEMHDLEVKLEGLLEKYTDKHPDVIRTKREIEKRKKLLKKYPEKELDFARIAREVDMNKGLVTSLKLQYESARIKEAEHVADVIILDPPRKPFFPIVPDWGRNLTVGWGGGLLVGLVLAFLLENLNTSLGGLEDAEAFLKVPILGVIPHIHLDKKRMSIQQFGGELEESDLDLQARLVTFYEPKSPISEAYRTLRTNIQYAATLRRKVKTIMFTSAEPKEGKTISAANVGIVMAQTGQKVLLVSADLRVPTLEKLFGLSREPGLTDILVEDKPWRQVVRTTTDLLIGKLDSEKVLKTTGIDSLDILTAGKIPPNPAELISSNRFVEMLNEFKEHYDLILIDCTPIFPVTDAISLSTKVDGVILVCRVGRTSRGAIRRGKAQLEGIKANILGAVLNDLGPGAARPGYYYSYKYYRYGYGEEGKKKEEVGAKS